MHLQAKEMKCGKVMQKQLYCKTQLTKKKVQSNKRQFHMGKKQSGQKKEEREWKMKNHAWRKLKPTQT